MRVPACFAALVLSALAAPAAWADGLFYQLPEDGTWARYDLEVVETIAGGRHEARGSVRVASVGRVTENGPPCRWIEVGFEVKEKERLLATVRAKILIPEKHLTGGKDPLKHAVRAWMDENRRKPRKLEDPTILIGSPLMLPMAAPLKDAAELKPVVVRSKLGELPCKGVEGTVECRPNDVHISARIRNRLHPKAPFGIVSSHWDFEQKRNKRLEVRGTFDLKLADFGTGAKSEMPEQR